MRKILSYIFPAVVLFLFITLAAYQPAATGSSTPKPGSSGTTNGSLASPSLEQDLPVVGSADQLKRLLQKALENNRYATHAEYSGADRLGAGGPIRSAMKSMNAQDVQEAKSSEKSKDYSSTNVQVQGVDEADVIKTDGEYIYQVNNQRVIISKAYPADEMKVVKTLTFNEQNFHPNELYIDEKYMVVVGSDYHEATPPRPAPEAQKRKNSPNSDIAIYPSPMGKYTTKAVIYDITDISEVQKIREVELEGHYVSSRKIGGALYLVANKEIDYYYIMEKKAAPPTPSYRDTAGKDRFIGIGCETIRYFPESPEPNYLLIGALNLDQPDKEIQLSTYLGTGQNIYSSLDNLYIAVTQYVNEEKDNADSKNNETKDRILPMPTKTKTGLYKFALQDGTVEYKGKGEVPGTILNQFSMDEYNEYFRIATTTGQPWGGPADTSKNNVFVLDKNLKISGKLEDIAPGERIYSTRFMGGRLYMVTFKKVDPLFVIGLEDPKQPKILGALKIPGYSDYLHPYDDKHIIGFGKDTVEASGEASGGDAGSFAYYQGMKVALFDVSDVSNPIEKHKVIIGDRGTDSELLYNHKALLFNKEKNLLAFPVTLMEINGPAKKDIHSYGQFTFQGLYVYQLEPNSGFNLRGRITHLTGEEIKKAGYNWYDSEKNVERALYINNTLYTLSKSMIKANDLVNLEELNSLHFEQ